MDGSVRCWGAGGSGQLGDGGTTSTGSAVVVTGLSARALELGSAHSCALTTTGELRCWGANLSGQLGDGSRTDRTLPVLTTRDAASFCGGGEFSSPSVADAQTCAVRTDGTLACWGSDAEGRLGIGSGSDLLVPTAVPGLADLDEVGCGPVHTCARSGGSVWCWGRNTVGQLGDGTTTRQTSPVVVRGL
jgi:alpha-tubulin suppressor-like RCC1 family protein